MSQFDRNAVSRAAWQRRRQKTCAKTARLPQFRGGAKLRLEVRSYAAWSEACFVLHAGRWWRHGSRRRRRRPRWRLCGRWFPGWIRVWRFSRRNVWAIWVQPVRLCWRLRARVGLGLVSVADGVGLAFMGLGLAFVGARLLLRSLLQSVRITLQFPLRQCRLCGLSDFA